MIYSFLLDSDGIRKDLSIDEMKKALKDKNATLWVDLEAPTEEESQILTEVFNFHPLAVEDCIKTAQHPKIDNYEDYLFIALHAIRLDRNVDEEYVELELDMFVSKNYVVTYHHSPVRSVTAVREKCLYGSDSILKEGTDFLAHKVIDTLVDNYLPILLQLEHDIDMIEDSVFDNTTETAMEKILQLKKEVIFLKTTVNPQRNAVYKLAHASLPFIQDESRRYFSDIYDNLHHFIEELEELRDVLNGVVDTYLSITSVRMNQVMKTLTVVMTIIMPLTLITGIYGMNFKNMPEISSPYGYPLTILFMILLAVSMFYFMKRKNWF